MGEVGTRARGVRLRRGTAHAGTRRVADRLGRHEGRSFEPDASRGRTPRGEPHFLTRTEETDGRSATFDLLILGGGMSYVGAIRAAQLGLSVGLVERDKLGGTCLNRGCIPSKALLETADLLHRVTEQGAEFGLAGHEGISLDYGALGTRRDAVIEKHVSGVEFLMKKNKVTVLQRQRRAHRPDERPRLGRRVGRHRGDRHEPHPGHRLRPALAARARAGRRRIITSDEALARGDVRAG